MTGRPDFLHGSRRKAVRRKGGKAVGLLGGHQPARLALPPYRLTALPPYRLTAVPPYRPSASHNHAAPRTPLESPCRLGSSRVTTVSEKTYPGSTFDTASGSRGRFDIPPPSTTASGSRVLMTAANARARRFWYRCSASRAITSPSSAARAISSLDRRAPDARA